MSSNPTGSLPNATLRLNGKDTAAKPYHQRPQPDHGSWIHTTRPDRHTGSPERVLEPQPASSVPPHLKVASRFLSADRSRFSIPVQTYTPIDGRSSSRRASLSSIVPSDDPNSTPTPAALSPSASGHDGPFAPFRTKKDSLRGAPPGEPRHRHPQPLRSIPPAEPLRREPSSGLDRIGFPVSLTSVGWESMQREVELLRKAVQDMHRTTKKQTKRIDELKTQLSANAQQLKERENEVVTLKERCLKSETVMNVVEASIQCQICMELPLQPFALSPCGHVLCLTCLQEWFKTTPGGVDEDEDEEHPEAALLRPKTCPCCRTAVRHRPSHVFMVKAVATALLKEKEPGTARQAPPVETHHDDPWKGIFPNSDDEESNGGDDDSAGDLDDDDVEDWMLALNRHHGSRFSWSSDSEDEESYPLSGRYADYDDTSSEEESSEPARLVVPRWEPATVHINPQDFDLAESDPDVRESILSLLRRGCSWDMIQNFNLRYSHAHGIVVALNSIDDLYSSDNESFGDDEVLHHVYLGWNIALDGEDSDGERYIHSILFDIRNRPERWRISPSADGGREVRKLVSSSEVEEYSTTDSDVWHESDSDDVDD